MLFFQWKSIDIGEINMKKYISLLMALVLLLCLSGCGQEKTIEYFDALLKEDPEFCRS